MSSNPGDYSSTYLHLKTVGDSSVFVRPETTTSHNNFESVILTGNETSYVDRRLSQTSRHNTSEKQIRIILHTNFLTDLQALFWEIMTVLRKWSKIKLLKLNMLWRSGYKENCGTNCDVKKAGRNSAVAGTDPHNNNNILIHHTKSESRPGQRLTACLRCLINESWTARYSRGQTTDPQTYDVHHHGERATNRNRRDGGGDRTQLCARSPLVPRAFGEGTNGETHRQKPFENHFTDMLYCWLFLFTTKSKLGRSGINTGRESRAIVSTDSVFWSRCYCLLLSGLGLHAISRRLNIRVWPSDKRQALP